MMDNKEYKKVLNSSVEFFKNYSESMYGENWKLCLSWSVGNKMKSSMNWKYMMERMKYYVMGLGLVNVFDGVYVSEYNRSGDNLHLHSMIYVDGNERLVKDRLWKYCSNKGSVDVKIYDEDLGFDYYMSKYLYVRNENNWGILGIDV